MSSPSLLVMRNIMPAFTVVCWQLDLATSDETNITRNSMPAFTVVCWQLDLATSDKTNMTRTQHLLCGTRNSALRAPVAPNLVIA